VYEIQATRVMGGKGVHEIQAARVTGGKGVYEIQAARVMGGKGVYEIGRSVLDINEKLMDPLPLWRENGSRMHILHPALPPAPSFRHPLLPSRPPTHSSQLNSNDLVPDQTRQQLQTDP
jgi:hypothetical protein